MGVRDERGWGVCSRPLQGDRRMLRWLLGKLKLKSAQVTLPLTCC